MFQILYLLGPGILAWFIKSKCCQEDGENHALCALAEMVSYALVNMAIITAIFKPLGRIQLVVLPNGQMDVHYGVSALLASVGLAVLLGISSFLYERAASK